MTRNTDARARHTGGRPRHVVVVGAGPAGLAAAAAALRAGARVTLLDASDRPGGQYHRMLPAAYEAEDNGRLHHGWDDFERLRTHVQSHPRAEWWPDSAVWALERPDDTTSAPHVHVLRGPADGTERYRSVLTPDALVLATGAHDRVLPFPGWQLPGVFTAGAAQALAKGERVVVGDEVVVAGSGPFLLPVAASLLEAGSDVLEVLEANPASTVLRGWSRRPWELAAQSGKAAELAEYTGLLARHRVPYRLGRAVIEARGDGRVEEVVTARLTADWTPVPGTERTVPVDALCVTHGFSPQLELPVAAGCALSEGFVQVDDAQRTTAPGVYAAGEITGIAGAPAARAEGLLAGWTAAGGDPSDRTVRDVVRRRDRGRAFAARLAAAHPIGTGWPGWLRPDTLICRCEETDYRTLRAAAEDPATGAPRAVKLGTRAGLGPCQARMCGPAVADLCARRAPDSAPAHDGLAPDRSVPERAVPGLASASHHRRPVAQPIRLGELAASPGRPPEEEGEHTDER
ncbi:FAD/NAD(P)-dependent oxidoreductase [Actinomadura rupiterrae]|uniref:FAD/NAD(P)-dependent oxidoreductase n=1 Tax=Actinomadura rupiterrae TaxID=559627 RepID=UPI0020A582FB|nr:NAD(P)/FAD-dependent oxidoreductase [Actinomadura rupiterrae]MCP2341698.1 NADPH-dependent 2,4-dienoyl-CoA reductase/sulfur reductase-like enzyme [Actinomadura rupiterrae]